ncbi:MAG: phosphomannomutase/phosphoglucomutase, partial [Caldisericia bacterium]|nr:phosphomannomutase/phosphoglucomutase [Caldisericia bacterium]
MKKEIFREYDIRGIVETDLTDQDIEKLAVGFAHFFSIRNQSTVLIGFDNRLSSEPIKKQIVNILLDKGFHVIDIGCVITPIFYFTARVKDIGAGIMITASHNPGEYNGFKVYYEDSTIYGQDIFDIYKWIQQNEDGSDPDIRNKPKGTYETIDMFPTYKEYLRKNITLGPRKLRIALDCGNGTASLFAQTILEEAGVEVIPLYCNSDPTFPNHFPDPVKLENCKDLSEVVVSQHLDAGIGLDGDGDRVGVISEQGNPIWGDMIMVLLSREILHKHPGSTIICEVKCSQLLVDDIIKHGGHPIVYKTCHSLIKAKMKETNAICAGEMSGHIFLKDEYFGFDDAIYATLRILRILSFTEKPLSTLLSDLPIMHSTPE